MSDPYRGHDAKYWHGQYVRMTNSYLDTLLQLFEKDPELREDVLCSLDISKPGWRNDLLDFLHNRPRPQHVEYGGDD